MKLNRSLTVLAATLGSAISAMGQDHPRFELFGGYSFESIVPCGTGCREPGITFPPTDFNGWNASLTGYLYKSIGVTADFSGHYASQIVYDPVVGSHRYSYMFGPTYSYRADLESVFVHALFGEISQGSNQLSNLDYTKFAWILGCGLDLNMSRRIAIRAFQLDYERARIPSFDSTPGAAQAANGLRYSGGVVFKF